MQKQLKREDLKKRQFKYDLNKDSFKSTKSSSIKGLKKNITKFKKLTVRRYKGKRIHKNFLFLKKALKYFPSGRLLKYSKFSKTNLKSFIRFNVTVYPNNIFCNLKDGRSNKVIKSMSTGALKLKTTKKRLNFNIKNFLFSFLKQVLRIKKLRYSKYIYIRIISPLKLRAKVLEMFYSGIFKKFVQNKNVIFELPAKKVFNGCRPRKDLRKKKQVSLHEK